MAVMRCLLAAVQATQAGALLWQGVAEQRQDAAQAIPHFDAFLQSFGRSYSAGSEEYKLRQAVYESRAAAAKMQNSKQGRLWTAGVNYLWDWTEDEYARLRGYVHGARPAGSSGRGSQSGLVQVKNSAASPLPHKKSWAHLVAQRNIRNQGGCGSCWAIAAATVLQAHAEIWTKHVRTFSAQQLVSCVQNPQHCGGDGGCKGATVELAYAWVMENGLAEDYEEPYAGVDGTCVAGPGQSFSATGGAGKVSKGAGAFGMHGWERLPENKLEPLMRALAEKGPVAVSVSAQPWAVYEFGIFDGCTADAVIDHAVVLMGYGSGAAPGMVSANSTAPTVKFWTIQNSWGDQWGESGKIRLLRHESEESFCGINTEPEKGTGCNGGPPNVTVCGTCGILYDNVIPHF